MSYRNHQSGHVVFESLLAGAVIVLAIGAYLTYQSHVKAQSASINTTAAALSDTAKTAATNQKESQAALTRVKSFYRALLTGSGAVSFAYWQQQGYTTAAVAADDNTTADKNAPFVCTTSATSYSEYSFSNPVVNGSTATMLVSSTVPGPPRVVTTIHLGLKKIGSNWEINAFTCPASK
jgi:hypothetical protein